MGNLRVGVSKKEITPPVGTALSGYIRRFGNSKGIHDPLWANIIWITNGENQVLFISLDVMNISQEFSSRAKAALTEETGIAKENILMAAIHTHSAPGIHIFRDDSKRDKNWEERVLHTLVAGSDQARQRSKKALLGTETGQASIGCDRRKSGGGIDPYLTVAGFFDKGEKPFASIANYGCHPVVLAEDNLLISADYVGYFRSQLEKFLSSEVTTLFFTGAAGNVDPIERGSFQVAERLAEVLAIKARQVMGKMKLQSSAEIKTAQIRIEIPYGWIPSAEEAQDIYRENLFAHLRALEKGGKEEKKIQKAFLLWAEALREKARAGKLPHSLECDLQAVKVGEAVFLAFPFELFSALSLDLRSQSGIQYLFLLAYANGYHGYLADEKSVRDGGYETEEAFKYTGLQPFSAQGGNIFLKNALSLLEMLGTK
jgi:neutral ceramidase